MPSDIELQAQIRHIGHEIRNNLSICDIYSEILKKHIAKENIQNPSINNAIACIQNAAKLIGNNLLDLKSMGETVIHTCESDKIIQEAVDMAKIYAKDKSIEFRCDLVSNIRIQVDENKFQGCIINIIKNAVEAIENSGYIKITSELDDESLNITISNNGPEISKSAQDEIFNDGFTTKKTGSGIGLYLCRNNLAAMGGSLELLRSTKDVTEFGIRVNACKM